MNSIDNSIAYIQIIDELSTNDSLVLIDQTCYLSIKVIFLFFAFSEDSVKEKKVYINKQIFCSSYGLNILAIR
jgi:hypothetical protein